MANPLRGEVDLVVGDRTYTLRFRNNAQAEVTNLLGMGLNSVLSAMAPGDLRPDVMRAVVWASLREHHPKITLLDVSDLIDEAGQNAVLTAMGEAFSLAFPDADSTSNPRKPSGTGKASSPGGSRSASRKRPSGR
jgi:hypothetical protein